MYQLMRLPMVAVLAAMVGCGYGTPARENAAASSTVAGRVVKGPVAQSLVTAFRLNDAMARGEVLASATTDDAGGFTLTFPAYSGNLLLVATGGTYVEEAVGTPVRLEAAELTAAITKYRPGKNLDGIAITPVSHLIAGLAQRYVQKEGASVVDAVEEAAQHLNAHFGGIDWLRTSPTDLTASTSPQLDVPARAGLLLAALSMQARGLAESAGLTPGSSLNTMTLVAALYDDLTADGFFDGGGKNGSIRLPPGSATNSYKLDGQAVRLSLALATQRFLGSDRNMSSITATDTRQLRYDLSNDSNPRIFRDSGSSYDIEPPQVQLAGEPPAKYTQQSQVTIAVIADDGAGTGVRQVFARNGTDSTQIAAVLDGGTWFFKAFPLHSGRNELTIFAEDNATPPNSGATKGAPNELKLAVTVDTTLPSPAFLPLPAYYDERELVLEQVDGVPTMPAKYSLRSTAVKVPLVENGEIWKVQSRLSSASPSPADLEGANAGNVPFLQVFSTFNPDTEAPIEEARYTIAVSCSGCPSFPESTGLLLRSARIEPQKVFFDLPITAEVVPALTQLTSSPALLRIRVTAKDAAGNVGDVLLPLTLNFHVLGAPVAWREESNYQVAADVRSVFRYKLVDGSYGALWRPSADITADTNGAAHASVRFIRYVLRNPHPSPVALRKAMVQNASWTSSETWADDVWPHTKDLVVQGTTVFKASTTMKPTCPDGTPPGDFATYPRHKPNAVPLWDCPPTPYPASAPGQATAMASAPSLSAVAFATPLPKGAERGLATTVPDASGQEYWVIPPAEGSNPGELVVYVERPLVEREYSWDTHLSSTLAYRTIESDFYECVAKGGPGNAYCNGWGLRRHAKRLTAAVEKVTGNITWQSSGVRRDGKPLGDLYVTGNHSFDRTAEH